MAHNIDNINAGIYAILVIYAALGTIALCYRQQTAERALLPSTLATAA